MFYFYILINLGVLFVVLVSLIDRLALYWWVNNCTFCLAWSALYYHSFPHSFDKFLVFNHPCHLWYTKIVLTK